MNQRRSKGKNTRGLVAACLLAVVAGGACVSGITGNDGAIDFSYRADDQIGNYNKAIAVGARLDIRVADTNLDADLTIVGVTIDDESVLRVVNTESNRFTVEGVAPGSVLISIEAENANGEAVTDSVNMRVAEARSTGLSHECTSEPRAAYFANARLVRIGYELMDRSGNPAIGYGYRPFEFDPELGELEEPADVLGEIDQDTLVFNLGSTIGEFEVRSTIDDTALLLNVIEVASVDGLEAAPTFSGASSVRVDQRRDIRVWAKAGADDVCGAVGDATVTVLTPETCLVGQPIPKESMTFMLALGTFPLIGVAPGECRYEVSTDAGAQAGETAERVQLVQEFSFPVEN